MPTIGEENNDLKPSFRGTAEQDTLRRDLTVNAMLLQVELAPALSFQTPKLPDQSGTVFVPNSPHNVDRSEGITMDI